MKQLLLIGGMIFFSVWSNAQLFNNQPSVMRGVLVDKTNNLKLEAAFITFDFGTHTVVAMTDSEGSFILTNIPKNVVTVKIVMPGYEDKVITNIQSLEDVEYHIAMEPKKVLTQLNYSK
ncbi:MAG: hypothetical protein IPL98_18165 [Saprospiraceae bacterium]|jgi:hypothetical protein|nr:hypothetical protein [Saprospiraceae bacterium]